MADLPRRKADRVVGETYLYKGENRVWDGKILRCEHGRRKGMCKDCGTGYCKHGRLTFACKECGGPSICEHGRRRTQCRECDGGSFCEHGRSKSVCRECDGGSFCEHGILKWNCRECDGSNFCEHGRRKQFCKDCKGSSICPCGKHKWTCDICDPNGAIIHRMRARIHDAIKRGVKTGSTVELLGCNPEKFRKYIENLWEEGMNWENYGKGPGKWNYDHSRPCESFTNIAMDPIEQRMCFHYTNMEPMWEPENQSKAAFFDPETFDREWTGEKWVPIE